MFCDFNIPYPSQSNGKITEEQLINLKKILNMLQKFGYEAVAFNNTISGKIPNNGSNPIQTIPIDTSDNKKDIKQYSRLTIIMNDASQNYSLNSNNETISAYDIIAIQPQNEKIFQLACSVLDIDIISLDFSTRLPFYLKLPMVNLAIERGIHFEINYSVSLRDNNARKHLISNAANLARVTRGKNIIISSEAQKALEIRGPYDIINLSSIFGLNQALAKNCITSNCRKVLLHSKTRKNIHKGVVSISTLDELEPEESWKAGDKDLDADVLHFDMDED
ncbi:PHP domain-like protein [Piromyces finnis]|uniref:PHP domain-like protein n=1 Tax=Piromyces finnis TaxID=1754191 RepID=A0A1Y1V9Q4_9FUNG|nr:PHP domain-like protein [Piromyces finnis]|eukprot:ORX50653.1 PHP domain-like protein [Piromyces finnis]